MTKELRRRGWVVNPKRVRPSDARGQLVVRADAEVRGHHRLQPRAPLDRTLEDELALGALRMGLARRIVEPGLSITLANRS